MCGPLATLLPHPADDVELRAVQLLPRALSRDLSPKSVRDFDTEATRGTPGTRLREDLDVAVCAVHADQLPVANQAGCALDANDSREAVFARDHGAMRHQTADLCYQT